MNGFALRFALGVSALQSLSVPSQSPCPRQVTFATHATLVEYTDPNYCPLEGSRKSQTKRALDYLPLPTNPNNAAPLSAANTTKLLPHFQRRLQILKEVTRWRSEEVLDKINEHLNELTAKSYDLEASTQSEIELFKHLKRLAIAWKISSISNDEQVSKLNDDLTELNEFFSEQSVENYKSYLKPDTYITITDQFNNIHMGFQSAYTMYQDKYSLGKYHEHYNTLCEFCGLEKEPLPLYAPRVYPIVSEMTDSKLQADLMQFTFFTERDTLVTQLLRYLKEYTELLKQLRDPLSHQWDEQLRELETWKDDKYQTAGTGLKELDNLLIRVIKEYLDNLWDAQLTESGMWNDGKYKTARTDLKEQIQNWLSNLTDKSIETRIDSESDSKVDTSSTDLKYDLSKLIDACRKKPSRLQNISTKDHVTNTSFEELDQLIEKYTAQEITGAMSAITLDELIEKCTIEEITEWIRTITKCPISFREVNFLNKLLTHLDKSSESKEVMKVRAQLHSLQDVECKLMKITKKCHSMHKGFLLEQVPLAQHGKRKQYTSRKLPCNTTLAADCTRYLEFIDLALAQAPEITIHTFEIPDGKKTKLLQEIFFPQNLEVSFNHTDSARTTPSTPQTPSAHHAPHTVKQHIPLAIPVVIPDFTPFTPQTPSAHQIPRSTPHSTQSVSPASPYRAQRNSSTTDTSIAPINALEASASKIKTISAEQLIFMISIIPLLVFFYLVYKKTSAHLIHRFRCLSRLRNIYN